MRRRALLVGVEPTILTAIYNITSTTSPTQIGYDDYISGFTAIEIDGVKQPSVVSAYTFSTLGEHTVKYTLTKERQIGAHAFRQCSGLTSIDIPNGVTSIGGSAFYYCSGLTSIDIPSSVKRIREQAFQKCSSLTRVNSTVNGECNIPSGLNTINDHAFEDCIGLTRVFIPSSVNGISPLYNPWASCPNLTAITVDSNNAYYDSRNNCNAIIEKSTNKLISGCENTVIPNTVTSIYESAFRNCSGLTSIDVPSSVTSIGQYAFVNCYGLTSLTIGSGVTSIGTQAFYYCSGLTSCTFEQGSQLTSIGNYALYGCSSLTSIDIPSGVTSIGGYAFAYCSRLSSITSLATTAPTITSNTFIRLKSNGTLTVPIGSSGYDVWMQNANYYLGKYNWAKVEQ